MYLRTTATEIKNRFN